MQRTATAIFFASAVLCPTQALLAAEPVSSGPGGTVFYSDGRIELGYYDSGSNNQGYAYLETDLGWEPQTGGIGFSLGIDAFAQEDGDTDAALYPALVYSSTIGRFSIGAPRPVLTDGDGYIPAMVLGKSTIADLQLGTFIGSYAGTSALFGDEPLYGLRYDGSFGNTKVGFSYHRLDSGTDYDIYNLAFRHELGAISSWPNLAVFGGYERFEQADADSFRLGIEGGSDTWSGGLVWVGADGLGPDDLVLAYTDFQITEALSGAASLGYLESGGFDSMLYSLGLEYTFANNVYVKASYLDDDSSGDGLIDVSLGLKF